MNASKKQPSERSKNGHLHSSIFGTILGGFFDQKVDQKNDAEIYAKKVTILMKNRCKNGVQF